AADMPGVVRIFTGDDFREKGSIPCGWQVTDRQGEPMKEPRHPILAEDFVRHVGDPIAAVVAETLAEARDAAEAIELDIEVLPADVDVRAALEPGSRTVHDGLSDNLCFDWGFLEDNRASVHAASASAHHVTTLDLVNNRLIANPTEPRVAIGEFGPSVENY